jgi:hypothetical protein
MSPLKGGALQKLGVGIAGAFGGPVRSIPQRRDMLADEDTRQFGGESVYGLRDGSGGSAWSLLSAFGGAPPRSSHSSAPWREKSDPFSDSAALMMQDEPPAAPQQAKLSHHRPSYASGGARSSYIDPFADSPVEEPLYDIPEDTRQGENTDVEPSQGIVSPPDAVTQPLSPLSKQASRSSDVTTTVSSHAHGPTSFDASRASSRTSNNDGQSSSRMHSSILDSYHPPNQPIQRSNSWWTRFAKTPFLDRKSSDASQSRPKALEFRDPNPPPRLVAIQEASGDSNIPNPQDSDTSRKGTHHKVYSSVAHGRSMSSMKTSKTADSEMIERMGGMDVVQRMGTSDSSHTSHTSEPNSPESDSHLRRVSSQYLSDEDTVESPTEMKETDMPGREDPFANPLRTPRHVSLPQGGVAARVHAYERRMSRETEGASSPPLSPGMHNTRRWEERPAKKGMVSVNYGLVPRPSLYVANPDRDRSVGESSSDA